MSALDHITVASLVRSGKVLIRIECPEAHCDFAVSLTPDQARLLAVELTEHADITDAPST